MARLVVGFLLLSMFPVYAQTIPPEAAAREMLILALDNIQRARCTDPQPCSPATPEGKANPPITVAEAQRIIHRAALSGVAERCGLDWRRQNFVPMMDYWRKTQKKNERQMALIALLHGIMMSRVDAALASKPSCTDQERKDLESNLAFRP